MLFGSGSATEHDEQPPVAAIGPSAGTYAGTPIGFRAWVTRTMESAVPVFPMHTPRREVLKAVKEADLEILRNTRDFLLVRDSVMMRDGSGQHVYLYGFEKGKLVIGPDSFYDRLYRGGEDGLDAEEVRWLTYMLEENPPSARTYNTIAWICATYDIDSVRDPKLAVRLALRANELNNYENPAVVDTLAAAYARAGDFDNAVSMQERAIAMQERAEPGMHERLDLYRNGKAYTEPVEKAPLYDGRRDRSIPEPISPQLLVNANRGNTRAQFLVSRYYLNNDIDYAMGIENPGLHWLRLAADAGDTWAMGKLGAAYVRGSFGVERNPEKGRRLLELAADQGEFVSAFNLSRFYSGKPGVEFPWDEAKASEWLQRAAELGMQKAIFEMAYRLDEGIGVERAPEKKKQHLASLALANYDIIEYLKDDAVPLISYEIEPLNAHIRADGEPGHVSLQRIMSIVDALQEDVENNALAARFDLDDLILMFHPEDATATAASLARSAARLGYHEAQLRVADYYESGFGLDPDPEIARRWRQRAAQNPNRGVSAQQDTAADPASLTD